MSDGFQFDRSGDHLALDFANTVDGRRRGAPVERLPDYAALVAFARQLGLTTPARAARLLAWAAAAPEEARAVRIAAVRLREALYRLFGAIADGARVDDDDLALLNERVAQLRLGGDFAWHWAAGAQAPDAWLLPIVRAAVELITSDARARVRRCEADDCGWLILDTSKNRTRRWCDMKSCGNRMKARRFQERRRAAAAPARKRGGS
jgi:predicted RNA-binding Zn ribbon-like protein